MAVSIPALVSELHRTDTRQVERKVDAVICATGFDTSLKPRFPIIGQDGVSLHDRWGDDPDAYMGMTVPNLPNFVTMCGPYCKSRQKHKFREQNSSADTLQSPSAQAARSAASPQCPSTPLR